ncbi:hypothetical protein L798_03524 [Zootermopsis nevadensis]|uniref:Uncharacterized protein n=1 Tax=Zootermopsis nevadensis TaxID=136037 RepID=A0A067RD68_ZOONE|nr:hypothetical protein L798_03524 [Zootermopsis nevadensis]
MGPHTRIMLLAFCLFEVSLAFNVGIRSRADDSDFLPGQPSDDHVIISDLVPEESSVVIKPVSYSYTTKNTDQKPLGSVVHASSPGDQQRRSAVNHGTVRPAASHDTVVHHVTPQRSDSPQQHERAAAEENRQPRHEKTTHHGAEPSRKHVYEEQQGRKHFRDEDEEGQEGTRNLDTVARHEEQRGRKQPHREPDVEEEEEEVPVRRDEVGPKKHHVGASEVVEQHAAPTEVKHHGGKKLRKPAAFAYTDQKSEATGKKWRGRRRRRRR